MWLLDNRITFNYYICVLIVTSVCVLFYGKGGPVVARYLRALIFHTYCLAWRKSKIIIGVVYIYVQRVIYDWIKVKSENILCHFKVLTKIILQWGGGCPLWCQYVSAVCCAPIYHGISVTVLKIIFQILHEHAIALGLYHMLLAT